MPYIMPKSDRFNEILVQPKAPPDRPGDFGYDLHMDDAMGDVVVFDKVKDLRLVDVPCVCPCMDDSISIPGVGGADILRFSVVPPHGISAG